MKTVCIATVLALLAGSAAHAGSIIDTLISEGSKHGVKKSDISSMIKGFDIENKLNSVKSMAKERDKAPATAERTKPSDTAPASRAEDWNVTPSRRDEPVASRYDERPASRFEEKSSPTTTARDVAPVEQKTAVVAPAPVASDPKSPIGEWIPEDGEGRVRIRACGQALCGVVSVADPNDTDRHNPDASKRNRPVLGMPVLIDMKSQTSNRWAGQIYNVKNGKTYNSNITLKNPNVLRVEGCVLGGLFCGGQDWTRVKDSPQG